MINPSKVHPPWLFGITKVFLKNTWNDIEDENEKAPKKRFRESGGGRKPKAPEVETLFSNGFWMFAGH